MDADGEGNYHKIYIAEHLWDFDLQIQKNKKMNKIPL